MIPAVLAMLMLVAGVPPLERQDKFGPVRIIDETVRYPIEGRNLRELSNQLRNHGPWTAGSGHGRTRSVFELRSGFEEQDDGCHLVDLELALWITVTLPDWQSGSRAHRELRSQWEVSLDRLVRHEDVHRQHAIDAAHELHQSLSQFPPQRSCIAMQRATEDLLRKAVASLRLRGAIYDERTANGLAELDTAP